MRVCLCGKCVEGKVSSGFDDLVILSDGQEANWEVVERILFIYAKLNPGHSYVQVSGQTKSRPQLHLGQFVCDILRLLRLQCGRWHLQSMLLLQLLRQTLLIRFCHWTLYLLVEVKVNELFLTHPAEFDVLVISGLFQLFYFCLSSTVDQ